MRRSRGGGKDGDRNVHRSNQGLGARLGLPKVDVDKLVGSNLKNLDALGRSAQATGEGGKAIAEKAT